MGIDVDAFVYKINHHDHCTLCEPPFKRKKSWDKASNWYLLKNPTYEFSTFVERLHNRSELREKKDLVIPLEYGDPQDGYIFQANELLKELPYFIKNCLYINPKDRAFRETKDYEIKKSLTQLEKYLEKMQLKYHIGLDDLIVCIMAY